MKIRSVYKKINSKNLKLKVDYDKKSKGRPAWIKIDGLPKRARYISITLGKKGKQGERFEPYHCYLPEGLFLPLRHTKEEMEKFYDKFSEIYNNEIEKTGFNINAANFFIKRVRKYIKKGELLDLGAGTGLITEIFVEKGFTPATLIDFSKRMLDNAKKRKCLRGSTFIKKDVRKLNLGKRFDLVISFFSVGASSYFDKKELNKILKIAKKHLKKNGVIAVLGHLNIPEFEREFKKLESGIYNLSKKNKFYVDYFIGGKR